MAKNLARVFSLFTTQVTRFGLVMAWFACGLGWANSVLAQQSSAPGQPSSAGSSQAPAAAEADTASPANAPGTRPGAKDGAPPRSFIFTPTFDSTTSVVNTTGQTGVANSTSLVVQLKPGFEAFSRSGRLLGSVIYFADTSYRNTDSTTLRWRNSLNAKGSAELVPGWAYADLRASVLQQARFAQGQQSTAGSQSLVENVAEVGNVSLSPFVRGNIGDLAAYEARATGELTNVRKSITGDYTNSGALLRLSSPRSAAFLGWLVEANQSKTVFRSGGTTDENRVILQGSVRPQPDLSLSARGGRENATVAGLDRRSYNNVGGGLQWNPSRRVSVFVDYDKRYFGQSYRAAIEYRVARSSFQLNASRATNTNQVYTGGAVTAYDIAYFAFSGIADPAARSAAALAYLRDIGKDPNQVVGGGFVSSGVSVVQNLDATWIYTDRRTTYTMQAFSITTNALNAAVAGITTGEVRQSGLNAYIVHRLTPTITGNLGTSLLHTTSATGSAGTDLKNLSLRVTSTVNRYTTATLGARYTIFDSPTEPYREAALSAILILRF